MEKNKRSINNCNTNRKTKKNENNEEKKCSRIYYNNKKKLIHHVMLKQTEFIPLRYKVQQKVEENVESKKRRGFSAEDDVRHHHYCPKLIKNYKNRKVKSKREIRRMEISKNKSYLWYFSLNFKFFFVQFSASA